MDVRPGTTGKAREVGVTERFASGGAELAKAGQSDGSRYYPSQTYSKQLMPRGRTQPVQLDEIAFGSGEGEQDGPRSLKSAGRLLNPSSIDWVQKLEGAAVSRWAPLAFVGDRLPEA